MSEPFPEQIERYAIAAFGSIYVPGGQDRLALHLRDVAQHELRVAFERIALAGPPDQFDHDWSGPTVGDRECVRCGMHPQEWCGEGCVRDPIRHDPRIEDITP